MTNNTGIAQYKQKQEEQFIKLKKNYIGLDIFRLVLLVAVCAFHTTVHLEAYYGPLQAISKMGAVFNDSILYVIWIFIIR